MSETTVTPEADKALTEREVATRWGITQRTLYNWRMKGTGPRHFMVGSKVKYMLSEVVRHEQQNTHEGGASRESGFPAGSATNGIKSKSSNAAAQ